MINSSRNRYGGCHLADSRGDRRLSPSETYATASEGRPPEAETRGELLVSRADRLASQIAEHQATLSHLLQGGPAETTKRLRILFSLVGETRVARDRLLAISGASISELFVMSQLGLIRPSAGAYALTRRAEFLLGILLFFDAKGDGAVSKGFSDLLQGALYGGFDATTMSQILAAGARRLSEELGDQTRTESLRVLDEALPERRSALEQLERMLGRLTGKIDRDSEDELRSAANELNAAYLRQEATHMRTWRQDVRYPQGHTHADVANRFATHTLESLTRALDSAGVVVQGFLNGVPEPSVVEIRRIFQREHSAPVDPTTLDVVTPRASTPRLRATFAQFLKEIDQAAEGDALHRVVSGARTYFVGASAALMPKHPLHRLLTRHVLRLHEERVHEGIYLDVPLITIHRRNPQ